MKNKKNTISVHELQAKASKVVKEVSEGKTYHIARYSKPTAVIISEDEYNCLTNGCRGCMKDMMQELIDKNK